MHLLHVLAHAENKPQRHALQQLLLGRPCRLHIVCLNQHVKCCASWQVVCCARSSSASSSGPCSDAAHLSCLQERIMASQAGFLEAVERSVMWLS
jgi:hypothetical protein